MWKLTPCVFVLLRAGKYNDQEQCAWARQVCSRNRNEQGRQVCPIHHSVSATTKLTHHSLFFLPTNHYHSHFLPESLLSKSEMILSLLESLFQTFKKSHFQGPKKVTDLVEISNSSSYGLVQIWICLYERWFQIWLYLCAEILGQRLGRPPRCDSLTTRDRRSLSPGLEPTTPATLTQPMVATSHQTLETWATPSSSNHESRSSSAARPLLTELVSYLTPSVLPSHSEPLNSFNFPVL